MNIYLWIAIALSILLASIAIVRYVAGTPERVAKWIAKSERKERRKEKGE